MLTFYEQKQLDVFIRDGACTKSKFELLSEIQAMVKPLKPVVMHLTIENFCSVESCT